MTIYARTMVKTVGGKTLRVMIRNGTNDIVADAAASALTTARQFLHRASGEVCQPGGPTEAAKSWASDFFCPDGEELTEEDWTNIKTVVTMTNNGLANDMTIKAGIPIRGDGDAAGQVRPRAVTPEAFFAAEPSTPEKGYQTFVASMKPGERAYTRRGAIHLRADTLVRDRATDITGVRTLIHEATHKFAGTWDYVYFSEMGGRLGNIGDRASAVGNADSYAWFVLFLNKKFWDW
jgi:hypothetical protein